VIQVACAVIEYDGLVAIAQRGPGRDEGLWEFPGGKQLPEETILECAEREIREELKLDITAKEVIFSTAHHAEKYGELILHYVRATVTSWRPVLSEHSAIRLVKLEELEQFQFTSGDRLFVNEYLLTYMLFRQ
jgi:8-oxo-dGTP pyrophosphatase MutT (NUDIX family)